MLEFFLKKYIYTFALPSRTLEGADLFFPEKTFGRSFYFEEAKMPINVFTAILFGCQAVNVYISGSCIKRVKHSPRRLVFIEMH